MSYLLVHHNCEDFNKWKEAFDDHSSIRAQHGSKGGKVFQSANNPNELFVLLEWDSIANAQKFAQSDSIKEAMKKAGVVGMPAIYFVDEAAKTSK
jgi:heme-degrading monooxygenase HmoA